MYSWENKNQWYNQKVSDSEIRVLMAEDDKMPMNSWSGGKAPVRMLQQIIDKVVAFLMLKPIVDEGGGGVGLGDVVVAWLLMKEERENVRGYEFVLVRKGRVITAWKWHGIEHKRYKKYQ